MSFPQNPFPIVGIVQGAGAGVSVTQRNLTTGEGETVLTESDNSFVCDPANLPSGYSDGDVIRIQSGSWYTDVKIDLENYPGGIEKNISRPPVISPRRISRGASLERGISCGF